MPVLREEFRRKLLPVSLIALCVSTLVALGAGAVHVPPREIVAMIVARLPGVCQEAGREKASTPSETIVLGIRLPRVILSAVVGASLSVSGAIYQGLFKNPMADPYVIGASAGASLGATCAFLLTTGFHFLGIGSVPLLAFTGSLAAVAVVYNLARIGEKTPILSLVLAGIAVSAVLSAVVSLLMFLAPYEGIHGLIFWLMGGFSGRRWEYVLMTLPYSCLGFGAALFYSRELNAMLLGEEAALHLGVEVEKVTKILVIAASLLTASAVAAGGIIGFVGLVIPHLVRMLIGPDHRRLVPAACVMGATFMMMADTIARTVIPPRELPVGIITALVGGPFFIYLLRQYRVRPW